MKIVQIYFTKFNKITIITVVGTNYQYPSIFSVFLVFFWIRLQEGNWMQIHVDPYPQPCCYTYKLQRLLLPAASPLRRWWPWEPQQRTLPVLRPSPPSTRPYTDSSGKLVILPENIMYNVHTRRWKQKIPQKISFSAKKNFKKGRILQWTKLHLHKGSFFSSSFLKFVMSTYNSVHFFCNACTFKRFLLCEMLV